MSGEGRAGGKVILLGEHAVVYGAPALAAGIDIGAQARAERTQASSLLHLAGQTLAASAEGQDLARAFHALLSIEQSDPVDVHASAELPPGGGLGCSAALGVAIARAVEDAMYPGEALNESRVEQRALAWERIFHGNPSGIDTAAAARGGCMRFTREHGAEPLVLGADLVLCVGSTGLGSATREMVGQVAKLRERRPKVVDDAVAAIASVVENGCLAAKMGDVGGLGRLMDLNQMLLATLMVSTEDIESMCREARKAGAFGAKLTGAGGGGAVIALVSGPEADAAEMPPSAQSVLDAWKAIGKSGFCARVSRQSSFSTAEAS